MPDKAITEFFEDRKQAWLKKSISASMSEQEVAEQQEICDILFSTAEWLPKAAKRAGQISMATHPCTFSHPSARKNKNGYVTPVIASAEYAADGFVRSGNVQAETDALGNAAALDVFKFLNLVLEDGETLIQHIADDSPKAKTLLDIPTADYSTMKLGFLAMRDAGIEVVTSSKIKQVYFPIEVGYHQLSLLTNSGMVYALRQRVDQLRFSEQVKQQRELRRKNEFSETGYTEIYDITTIGYGGTKPQNISVLNNKNGGKAHLLSSQPPQIKTRDIQFPTTDVFKKRLSHYYCRDHFKRLHKVFLARKDGSIPLEKLRKARDKILNDILDYLLETSWSWRAVSNEQFRDETSHLPEAQQVWLCEQFKEKRQKDQGWLDDICLDIAKWLERGYMASDEHALNLGPAERTFFTEWLEQQQEVLR